MCIRDRKKILFINLIQRENKQGEQQAEGEEEADSPLSREPDVGLQPGPRDHDLGPRQTLSQPSPPGIPSFSTACLFDLFVQLSPKRPIG